MNLYPLKFKPIYKDKIWGGNKLNKLLNKKEASSHCGESWEISGVQENISVVENGFLAGNNLQELAEIYMGSLVGDKVYNKFGVEFPLLIKFIDANDVLSVQVHPDDKISRKRHNAYGKTEMWYVMQADAGAELISGFNRETNKAEFKTLLDKKSLKDILNVEKVAEGDVYFLPAGRIHAIGSGIMLAEIQQTSDITYRVYDWDRLGDDGNPRELHIDLALDVIDYGVHNSYKTNYTFMPNVKTTLQNTEFFITNLLAFNEPVEKDYNLIDSFIIYMCLEGSFEIDVDNTRTPMYKGETVLVPAELKNLKLIPTPKAKILEVHL